MTRWWGMDHKEMSCGNDYPASALGRIRRKTNRRKHRDHSVLPCPYDNGLSQGRARAVPEDRQKPGRVQKITRQESHSSYLDGERPLHGGLGPCGDAPACAVVR